MEAQVKFVVVGHHTRREQAERLADYLDAHLLIDEGNHGANWNHRRSLEWAASQRYRVVIVEDDARPVRGFVGKVSAWLNSRPDDLISFYLGTGRPLQYQAAIAERLIAADKTRADFITLPQLIHGVCYSVPVAKVADVLARWDNSTAADYAVGNAYGGNVVYPCWSLVDHNDGESVEKHPDGMQRTERRRAWRIA